MATYGQRLPGEPMLVGAFQVGVLWQTQVEVARHGHLQARPYVICLVRSSQGARDWQRLVLGVETVCLVRSQAANVLHDAFEEPGVILWRKVRLQPLAAILELAMQLISCNHLTKHWR